MCSIAGGMCSGPSGLISIQNIFQCYGHESKIEFTQQIVKNSMSIGHISREIHQSPRVWLNILLGISFTIRKCGL